MRKYLSLADTRMEGPERRAALNTSPRKDASLALATNVNERGNRKVGRKFKEKSFE
jgi:hypothetical protein